MINKPASYGIITKGLGLPACKGMIVNHFQLGCFTIDVIEEENPGGGSHPYAPGEFYDEFRVTDPDKTTNYDQNIQRHLVVLKVRLGEKEVNQTYNVSKNTGWIVLKTLKTGSFAVEKVKTSVHSLRNAKFVSATINSMRTRMDTIKIKISSLRKDINNTED